MPLVHARCSWALQLNLATMKSFQERTCECCFHKSCTSGYEVCLMVTTGALKNSKKITKLRKLLATIQLPRGLVRVNMTLHSMSRPCHKNQEPLKSKKDKGARDMVTLLFARIWLHVAGTCLRGCNDYVWRMALRPGEGPLSK